MNGRILRYKRFITYGELAELLGISDDDVVMSTQCDDDSRRLAIHVMGGDSPVVDGMDAPTVRGSRFDN